MDIASTKLYAFWRYDNFPFFLGGPVTKMRGDGAVETENYGKGHWFHPVLILPAEDGGHLSGILMNIHVKHMEAEDKFKAEWLKKLRAELPEQLQKFCSEEKE